MAAQTKEMKEKTEALTDLWKFCELIKFFGGVQSFGQVHFDLCKYLEEGVFTEPSEKMVLMPRSHLKSTIGTCLFCLWLIYKNPNVRICINTHDLSLGAGFIRLIRQYLEDEDLQKRVWNQRPHIKGSLVPTLAKWGQRASRLETESEDKKVVWNASALQVIRDKKLKEPTVSVTSPNSNATGDHYDVIILDDVATKKNQETPEQRLKVANQVKELRNVLDPFIPETKLGGMVVWLGTRKHREDVYAKQFKRAKHSIFFRNVFKNGIDWTEGSLWPEKRTPEYLEALKDEFFKDADSKEWYSEYLNTITDDENAKIRSDSFRYFEEDSVGYHGSQLVTVTDLGEAFIRPTLGVDWAFTDNKKSDYCALHVAARVPVKNTVLVLDSVIKKSLPESFFPIIWSKAKQWNVGNIVVETNRAYRVVANFQAWLLKQPEYAMSPIPVTGVEQHGKKINRILLRLAPLYESNLIEGSVPAIMHHPALKGELLEQQLLDLGTTKDDGPDSLELTVAHLRGVSGRNPEEVRDQLIELFSQSSGELSPIQKLVGGTRG